MRKNIRKTLILLGFCLSLSLPVMAEKPANKGVIPVGTFTKEEIALWKERSFQGHTRYELISDEDALILKAHCKATGSAFYRDMKVDLVKTPILRWSWKIDNIHSGLDDISKAGDDYAARIYVVYKAGIMPWSVKALDYVWANKQPVGSSWPNAFTKQAIMIAQQSGVPEDKNVWIEETRDIRKDFKKYFGIDVSLINGVALMTDCDNSGGQATAYYRDIRFVSDTE